MSVQHKALDILYRGVGAAIAAPHDAVRSLFKRINTATNDPLLLQYGNDQRDVIGEDRKQNLMIIVSHGGHPEQMSLLSICRLEPHCNEKQAPTTARLL